MNISLDDYIINHIEAEPDYLKKIYRNTNIRLLNPRMQSGHYQGRLLKLFTQIINPNNILEIGTFSGYATLCIAEGMSNKAHIDTIEIDDELEDFIQDNFLLSPFVDKITLHIGDALTIVPKLNKTFELAFIDGNKRHYCQYFDTIFSYIAPNGIILVDNTLWSGKVLNIPQDNDYQTKEIVKFNKYMCQRSDIDQIILSIRDGLTIIRKK